MSALSYTFENSHPLFPHQVHVWVDHPTLNPDLTQQSITKRIRLNDLARDWLIENVGRAWWVINETTEGCSVIFSQKDHALRFKLTWG